MSFLFNNVIKEYGKLFRGTLFRWKISLWLWVDCIMEKSNLVIIWAIWSSYRKFQLFDLNFVNNIFSCRLLAKKLTKYCWLNIVLFHANFWTKFKLTKGHTPRISCFLKRAASGFHIFLIYWCIFILMYFEVLEHSLQMLIFFRQRFTFKWLWKFYLSSVFVIIYMNDLYCIYVFNTVAQTTMN